MRYEVRLLGVEDLPAAWELSRVAFGLDREPPPGQLAERPGRLHWGVFDGSGRLVAKAIDREQSHWFGGRLIPACGIAGVVVVPERRGGGLGRMLLEHLLREAHGRGAQIVTLFRSTSGPYRRLGCEEVGALTWTAVPAASLTVPRPDDVVLRPAEVADVEDIFAAYRTVARAGTGLMERSGPLFDLAPESVLGGHDGITVAVGPAGFEGYASWSRGPGYDAAGRISVADLIGLTGRATSALLSVLASWASVAPTIALRLPDADPARMLASFDGARVESSDRWLLRLLDAAGAVAARGWPPAVRGRADLLLEDELCPRNAGPHRLIVEDGEGRLEPGGSGAVRVGPRGLAVLYAGAATPAALRRAGLLEGDDGADAFLAAATAGPPPALLDYF